MLNCDIATLKKISIPDNKEGGNDNCHILINQMRVLI